MCLVQTRASIVARHEQEAAVEMEAGETAEADVSSDSHSEVDAERLMLPSGARLGDMRVPVHRNADGPWAQLAYEGEGTASPTASPLLFRRIGEEAGGHSERFVSSSGLHPQIPACEAHMKKHHRVFLMTVTHPSHGTSALQGLLMSSRHLTTLCRSGARQCSGANVMDKRGYGDHIGNWSYHQMLNIFGRHWDLHRRVLMDKAPMHVDDLTQTFEGAVKANFHLPVRFNQMRISHISPAYVLIWRPSCLWRLSANARNSYVSVGGHSFAYGEMRRYEELVQAHEYLTYVSAPVAVVNLGDVLWSSKRTVRRLEKFAPCLGKLDDDYLPRIGRDLVRENNWRADGSVRVFGSSVDPNSLGYNVKKGTCSRRTSLWLKLDFGERRRAESAELFLMGWSY